MGNAGLNYLCGGESYAGSGAYYVNVCADDTLRIYLGDYDNAINTVKSLNPGVIIWPYENAENIPPVFYDETPDPLPDYDVSGYPVSIQFNDYYYPNGVSLKSFKLYNSEGNEITDIRLIDENTDPNSEFSSYEYALFPLQRLDWNSTYTAEVVYEYNGQVYSKIWKFTTKALPYPYYKITTTDETIYIQSDKTYAYYFVPQNANDLIKGYSYTYPSGDSVESGMIDYNTVWIKVNGKSGDTFSFSFDNGDKLTLIIK
jgi:hypothetical protein